MWTLVGGGLKTFQQSQKPQADFIPPNADWFKDKVTSFDPGNNTVTLGSGEKVRLENNFC